MPALAREERPQDFSSVYGQSHVVVPLLTNLKSGKVSHAYLLHGPRGTGKTTIARLIAKYVNCEGLEKKPCGSCSSCSMITSGVSPDYTEVDAATYGGIEAVKGIIEASSFAPVFGRYRIYTIDECHMLTPAASNGLLKTLEEPPDSVIFILATTEKHKIMQTIVSRCQDYQFRLIDTKFIKDRLTTIAQKRGITLPEATAELLAKRAKGGLRDSISTLEPLLYLPDLSYEAVCQVLGIPEKEQIEKVFNYLSSRNLSGVISLINGLYAKGVDLMAVRDEMLYWMRELLYAKLKVVPTDRVKEAQALSFNKEDFLKITSELMQVKVNPVTPTLDFEVALVSIVTNLSPIQGDF